jgi:hypothetical protein
MSEICKDCTQNPNAEEWRRKMTKKELLKELEGLDNDAIIFVYVNEQYYHIASCEDKVAGVKMQNEITLICE